MLRASASFGQLSRLHEHGSTDQLGVSSAVVEVQAAVGDVCDVDKVGACGGQRRAEVGAPWPVAGIHLGVRSHARVEEQHAIWVFHHVAEAGLDP